MLRRENRLIKGVRFNNSYSFSTPQFVLKIKKNDVFLNRFGIVVSKKIDKRAVVRNKIKRVFKTALTALNKKMIEGYDMLFIIRPGILGKTKDETVLLIGDTLGKSGYIKK